MTATDEMDYTPEEMEAIQTLRARLVQDIDKTMYEDIFLFYRFLKARDFNLSQAEIMLRKHIQWRKTNNVDTIIDDYQPLEVLEKYIPHDQFAFDKTGSICHYLPVANYDSRGMHLSTNYTDLEKYLIRGIEMDEKLIKERSKNKNGKLPGYIYVYDMKDLPFALATDKKGIEDCIKFGKMLQDNYPERLKQVFIINASHFFTIPFAILKKFLAPAILQKMHLYGLDGWKEHLLRLIDAEDLPAFLGGKKTDPDGDPMCRSIINFAGPIPESYYSKKSKKSLVRDPLSKKLVLPRASFSEITLEVPVPGSLIQWEFETKSKDIAFGLFSRDDEDQNTELVPLIRLDTELFSETGVYKCENPGTYVMLFDNSYSWLRSKEIYYKALVVSPKELEAQLGN